MLTDIRATTEMTSDRDKLQNLHPYYVHDSVMSGDGAILSISHISELLFLQIFPQ